MVASGGGGSPGRRTRCPRAGGAPGVTAQGAGEAAAAALLRNQQVRGTGNTREITWLVAVGGDTPLKVILTSQKGGTKVKELTIQIEQGAQNAHEKTIHYHCRR